MTNCSFLTSSAGHDGDAYFRRHIHEGACRVGEGVQLLHWGIITNEVAWMVKTWQLTFSNRALCLELPYMHMSVAGTSGACSSNYTFCTHSNFHNSSRVLFTILLP